MHILKRLIRPSVLGISLIVAIVGQASAQRIRPLAGCSGLQITTSPSGVVQHLNSGPYSQGFTVYNCGSTTASGISLSCQSTGPVGCVTVNPTFRASLGAGASFSVTLTYNVGSPGIGQAQLWASWGDGFTSFGALGVTIDGPPTITLEPTETGPSTRAVIHNRTPVVRAVINAQFSAVDTTKTLLLWGTDTVTRWRADLRTVARWNRGLIEWEVDSIRGLNGSGADSALVTAKACAVNTMCTTLTRWVVLPADNAPVLGLTALPLGASGGFAAPFGPGLTLDGAELETGFASIPYFSMDSPRSVSLVYSTRQSYPRVLVPFDVELRWPAGNPTDLVARLYDGAVKLDSLKLSNPSCATGAVRRCRVVLQGEWPGQQFANPIRKWLRVEVSVTSGSTVTAYDSLEAVVVDRRRSPYGSGWWPSALSKLVVAGTDRILVAPNGSWTVYRGNGDSLYLPPPGSFAYLKSTGTGWELRARGDSASIRFDAYGRVIASVDRSGNRDSLVYGGGGLDTLKKIRDATGHEMLFTYAAGRLSVISDPAGRETKVFINTAGQLVYDSLSSPGSRGQVTGYAYQLYTTSGDSSVLLTRRIAIQDTTTVVYDSAFRRRPRQAILPTVQDPGGALVNPTLTYIAMESRGYGGLVRLDSAGPYVELKDPRGNWARTWPNRWGRTKLTWDTLGVLGRTAYSADGRIWYTEGKNGDSSRVYTAYDSLQRPVRNYFLRGSQTDIFRTDSIVYDAGHNVIQRIDGRGKVTKFFPDARGRDTMLVSPNSDTTRFALNANGTLASTRAPGDTGRTRHYFDAIWSNLVLVTTPHGDTVVNNLFDALGRKVASIDKVIVQTVDETPGTTGLQWRYTETFFTSANEADSTRMSRSDTCTGISCVAPSAWSWDSVHSMRVGMRYDRAGRDSIRVSGQNRETRFLYDRLGRLVSRRPPSDLIKAVPRDSMVYDLSSNLVRQISRRGDTTLTYYDARNRDTAMVIPGVGVRRKSYLGPRDQLTRYWVDSPVDSVGGVNGEMRWGYDSRGRLRADTAYRGTTPIVTIHGYDTFERVNLMTDPLGTFSFGYEANRGLLTQVNVPTGDTLYYVYDRKGRLTGPAVWRNGIKTKVGQYWNVDGALIGLVDTAWGTPYEIGRYGEKVIRDDGGVARLPLWLQRKNSFPSTPTDTLEDSPIYDGWERLTAWTQKKNGSQIASYAYSFDQYGNLYTSSAESYGAATDRLLRRTDPVTGHIWSYTYDANGNQVTARDSTPGGGVLTWTYGYNGLDQLVSVARSGLGVVARYGYDVLGRRIAKRVYSTGTGGIFQYLRFVYHGDQVAFETDSGGAVGWRYVWGIGTDRLLVAQSGASPYWISTDKLGSVRAVINPSWQQFQWHTPYAEATTSDGTSAGLRYGWTGREYDAETGYYFNRARYYSGAQRRFTQEDPIGFAGGENVYAYVSGRPLEEADPSGLGPDPVKSEWPYGCCVYTGALYDQYAIVGSLLASKVTPFGIFGMLPAFVTHPFGPDRPMPSPSAVMALDDDCIRHPEECLWGWGSLYQALGLERLGIPFQAPEQQSPLVYGAKAGIAVAEYGCVWGAVNDCGASVGLGAEGGAKGGVGMKYRDAPPWEPKVEGGWSFGPVEVTGNNEMIMFWFGPSFKVFGHFPGTLSTPVNVDFGEGPRAPVYRAPADATGMNRCTPWWCN